METEEFNCIGEYKNVIDQDDCDALIDLFEQFDRQGLTHQGGVSMPDGEKGGMINLKAKDSQDLCIFVGKRGKLETSPQQQQLIERLIRRVYECVNKYFYRVDKLMESPVWLIAAGSIFQPRDFVIKRYKAPDQGYHAWHADSGPGQINSKRVLAALIYLNDVEEGGETRFCHQNFASKPEAGKLILFPTGFTHIHKGERPISNDKYIINGWIQEGEHWLPPEPDIP